MKQITIRIRRATATWIVGAWLAVSILAAITAIALLVLCSAAASQMAGELREFRAVVDGIGLP